jgi:hypothetical protein
MWFRKNKTTSGLANETHTEDTTFAASDEKEVKTSPTGDVSSGLVSRSSSPPNSKSEAAAAFTGEEEEEEGIVYPSGPKLTIITIALCLSVFLIALV